MRPLAPLLALALALAFAPAVFAHEPPAPNTACDATQNPHDYTTNGENVIYGSSATGSGSHARYVAWDGNAADCNGDGFIGNEFDGDFEFANGGGAFPFGPWANDPTCDYPTTSHHGPTFHVHSSIPSEDVGSYVVFSVGSDPTPPALVPTSDPEDDDGFHCVADGSVTPDIDADDCLEYFVHGGTTTCAPGGDGNYHVWVYGVVETGGEWVSLGLTDADGDGIPDGTNPSVEPPTGISLYSAVSGHIYSS